MSAIDALGSIFAPTQVSKASSLICCPGCPWAYASTPNVVSPEVLRRRTVGSEILNSFALCRNCASLSKREAMAYFRLTNKEVIAYKLSRVPFLGVPCLKDLSEIQNDCMDLLPSENFLFQTSQNRANL